MTQMFGTICCPSRNFNIRPIRWNLWHKYFWSFDS